MRLLLRSTLLVLVLGLASGSTAHAANFAYTVQGTLGQFTGGGLLGNQPTPFDVQGPFDIGDAFTFTFEVDTNAPVLAAGGNQSAYTDAILNPRLAVTGASQVSVIRADATAVDERQFGQATGGDEWEFRVAGGSTNFSNDVPILMALDPNTSALVSFSFSDLSFLVFPPFATNFFSQSPPELVAPDPADIFGRQLIASWFQPSTFEVINAEFTATSITRTVVPEPGVGALTLLGLALLSLGRRRG
ncbi:MAG: PEP-CTERM sorting domain-containing protein [bacterium]|nr:PEP-CTERM sorting domain-containing protein [bacterium]